MEKNIFNDLNEQQKEAVKNIHGPVLIVSGPGSGKTKCLTHRIAYMIAQGIKAESILAVTFTNKAAEEIKERVRKLLGDAKTTMPTMGTFHSVCARLLRLEASQIGFSRSFSIYDEEDQLQLMKLVFKELDINPKKYNPKSILNRISTLKSELILPDDYQPQPENPYQKTVSLTYRHYHTALRKANAMDFDDLILYMVTLFQQNPAILNKYQNRFRYILVDEYQDTNTAQYVLTKLLAQKHRNLFAIGDTDQSIYLFRNADYRNMLNFEKDFPEAKVIHLEQNYRSTKTILAAAQGLIENNISRHKKDLWTMAKKGERVRTTLCSSESEEAFFIADQIKRLVKNGYGYNDLAVFYRVRAQSRALEEALLKLSIPYTIVGGVKFFNRREIKDILAYLRLLTNNNDWPSFQRIYNIPLRGVGPAALVHLAEYAQHKQLNVFKILERVREISGIPVKAAFNLYALGKDFQKLSYMSAETDLTILIKELLNLLEYRQFINDGSEEGEQRWENVKEMLSISKRFEGIKAKDALPVFLEEAALFQETDTLVHAHKGVRLMTLHSAKGLEFPVVFLAGLEEGLLPHSRSMFDPLELEEERRLTYVGITRAKEKLFLTFTLHRNIFGSSQTNPPSRFLKELPQGTLNFKAQLGSRVFYD